MIDDPSALVAKIEIFPVTVPRRTVFALQRGDSDQKSWFSLVKVTTQSGYYGWGECVTRVRSMHHVVHDHLRGRLIGHNVFDISGYHKIVDQEEMLAIERLWHWNPIRAALEMALFDIQGKMLNLPVAQLLGGIQRHKIPTVKNVGVSTPKESAELAGKFVSEGYTLLKVRVGANSESDERRLEAIRSAISDDISIRLDANQAWSAPVAQKMIDRFSEYGLEAIEQPCAFWDLNSNSRVTQNSPVPVISDEGFVSAPEAQLVLSARAADVLHAYIGKCGGIAPVMEIAAIAHSFGAQMTLGERVPLGISEAAHLHLAAALLELEYPCALAYDLNVDDLLIESPIRGGGFIQLPDGPGLGVDVDLAKLALYSRPN